ncbi:MAG: tetratricopeptide repeat protein [Bacteroidia bacterium]
MKTLLESSKFRAALIIQFIFAINGFSQLNVNAYLNEARTDMSSNNYFDAMQKLDICIKVQPGKFEAFFFRGVCKYFLNDDIGAEQDLNVAVTIYDPYLYDAYHYRSFVKYRLGDYEGAISDINQIIAIKEDDPKLYVERAFSKLSGQDYNGAISDCNKSLSLHWAGENLYMCKGMAENAINKFDSALINYNKALKINPKNEEIYVRIGMTDAAMSNYREAIGQYNVALKIDSVCTLAYYGRAEAYVKMNDEDSALDDLNTVIKYEPTNALAYFNRGIIEAGKTEYNDAIADFDKVLVLNPKNIQALFNRAKLKCSINDLQGALSDFNKTIDLFPYYIEAYYDRARVKESLHDYEGAKADYNLGKVMADLGHYRGNSEKLNDSVTLMHLTSLNSDFDNGGQKSADSVSIVLLPIFCVTPKDNNLGKQGYFPVLLKKNRKEYGNFCLTNNRPQLPGSSTDSALHVLNATVTDTSRQIGIIFKEAVEETNMQLFSDAVNDYDKIIKQDSGYAIAYLARAVNYCKEMEMLSRFNEDEQYTLVNNTYKIVKETKNDKYEMALADFSKLIQIEPDFAFAYYNRAYVKYKLQDFNGAVDDYSKAIQIDPDMADAYYNRGLLLFCLGDKLNSCQDFSKAGELGRTEAYVLIKRYCSQALK